MSTFGDMITRVKFQLDRSPSGEDEYVRREIISAIDSYKKERFVWNQKRIQFSTVADTKRYASGFTQVVSGAVVDVDDIFQIDWVVVQDTSGNGKFDMIPVDPRKIEILSADSTIGLPRYYAMSSGAFYIYSTPNQVYTVEMQALIGVSDLEYDDSTSDGSADPWMNEAEEMIRAKATANCYANWLRDPQKARMFADIADAEFLRHRRDYDRLNEHGSGIKPWYGDVDVSGYWGNGAL